jgi:dolichyl-diphosphooligosaccharide--protein glycosyltransferase
VFSLAGVWARAVVPAALFVWSLAVRAVGAPVLFEGKAGAYFFGNDAYYHARRIWYTVVNFPEFLTRDGYINYPQGARPIWSPAFDWLTALAVRIAVGQADQPAMERFLVWIPAVLGALTVVALYFLALRVFSQRVAVVSGLLLSVMPAHFWYSQIGFLDHHVAVALMTTWLLAATMNLIAVETGSGLSTRGLRAAIGLGLASGGALLVWPGCLIHVAIVEFALLVHLLASADTREAVARARLYALLSGVALVLVFPFSWGNEWNRWGSFSPLVLSDFQPLWFAGAVIFFGALAEVWRRRGVPASTIERLMHAVLVGGVAAGLALTFVPVLSGGVGEGWEWFAKGESFQSSVGESKSLFAYGVARPEQLFTRAIYLTPALLLGLAVFAWRQPRAQRDRLLFLVWWCMVLAAATAMQRRFMNSSSVGWSMLLAWGVCGGLGFSRDWIRRRTEGEGLAFVVLAGFLLSAAALLPVAQSYKPYLGNLFQVLDGKPSAPVFEVQRAQVVREAMAGWLRGNTPPTSGWLDASRSPEYAVLAPWSGGHVLKYVAHRPVIWDNFGDDVGRENFAAGKAYYSARSEEEALSHIDGLRVRYVVTREDHARRSGLPNPSTMMSRLSEFDGSETVLGGRNSDETKVHLEALTQHRLVYASVPLVGKPGEAEPYLKVFEIVAGARVRGLAPPGQRVMARLGVIPALYPKFHFVATTKADESGHYELVLPYSNESFSEVVEVASHYQIGIGKVKGRVRISEKAVQDGARVQGPSFQRGR